MPYQSIGQLNTKVQPTFNYVPRVITPKVPAVVVPKQTRVVVPVQPKQNIFQKAEGLGKSIGQGIVGAPEFFAKTDIINPAKELLASGNKQKEAKATQQSNVNLGLGKNGKNLGNSLKKIAGNSLQVASLGVGAGELGAGIKGADLVRPVVTNAIAGGANTVGSDLASNKKITAKGVATGAAVGAAIPIAGKIVGKTVGEGINSTKTVIGKNQAVNDLVDKTTLNQALTKAQNINRQATTRANLGGKAIEEANTTHIPVINPTETNSARSAIGSTAIANADKSTIPVSGVSTETTGKIAPRITPKQYVAKSTTLSNAYEKEYAVTNTLRGPNADTVRNNIDTKYARMQQDLDEQAGRTTMKFNAPSRRSALNPTNSEASVGAGIQPETNTIPVTTPKTETVEPTETTPKTQPTASTTATEPTTTPKTPSGNGNAKVSGSANRVEAAAVEKGLVNELPDKATYKEGSFKTESQNAVQLLKDDPEKARSIALGEKAGNNPIHEVAVRRAVSNKALQEGDVDTIKQIAQSPVHTKTSEAAQRLGAEGFERDPSDPVKAIQSVIDSRAKVAEKNTKQPLEKTLSDTAKSIKSEVKPVKRQEWHDFIKSLAC